MNEPELITAEEARRFIESGKAKKDQESYAKAVKAINDARNKGEFRAYLNGYLTQWAKKKVEEKGYKVESGSAHNESYTNISW